MNGINKRERESGAPNGAERERAKKA